MAAIPLEEPDFVAAHMRTKPVQLALPREHVTLLVPDENGTLEPHVPSMHALQGVRESTWDSLEARTRAHTPLVDACEVVILRMVHHGLAHRDMLRARDGRLPTMQTMRRWRQKVPLQVFPPLPRIFCGGLVEEDIGHLHITCERDADVVRSLCAKVEEVTRDLPLADRAMVFRSWKEHGIRWTVSMMVGVVTGDLRRLFAVVRAASPRGPAKAKLFLEDMILLGEDRYA